MNVKLIREIFPLRIRLTRIQGPSFGWSTTAWGHRGVGWRGPFLVLPFLAFTLTASAQPEWYRGMLKLPVSFDECKSRAGRALQAEGYSIQGQGGDHSGDYFFGGVKGVHSAVIACDSSPDGTTWVNFFVSSNHGTGDVAAERIKLSRQMSDPSGSSSNNLSSFAGEWSAHVENGYAFTMSLTQDGNRVSGTHDNGRTIIEGVVDGRTMRFRYRYKDSDTRGAGTLVLSDDGRSISGFYSHTDDPNNGSKGFWKGTRQ